LAVGVYVLIVELLGDAVLKTRGGRVFELQPGIYFYVGSAMGPRGVEARVKRHLSRKNKLFWHIDYLTSHPAARVVGYYVVETEEHLESAVASLLSELFNPVPGFGASDDPSNKTHLFKCEEGVEACLSRLRDALGDLGCKVKFKRIAKLRFDNVSESKS
jgi:Uri superfamily endonuclease